MKRSRFSDEQIVAVLHEWDAGAKMPDLVRRHGVTEQTLYIGGRRCSVDCRGTRRSDSKRSRKRIASSKRLVADQALNLQVVKDLLGKEW